MSKKDHNNEIYSTEIHEPTEIQSDFETSIINRIYKLIDKSEKITTKNKLDKDDNWQKTWMCIHFFSDSYREINGKGHAICKNGKCKIHYDRANPHNELLKHIIFDSPYRFIKTFLLPIIYLYKLYHFLNKIL